MSSHTIQVLADVGLLIGGVAVIVLILIISVRRANKKALQGPPVRDRVSPLTRDSRSQGGRQSGGGRSPGAGGARAPGAGGARAPGGRSGNGRPRDGGRSGGWWFGRRPVGPVVLPVDATVSFAAERSDAGIEEVFAGLEADLVGLVPVKQKVAEIGSLLLVDRARQKFGLVAPRPMGRPAFSGQLN